MAAKYFDIYIRPAGTAFAAFALTANLLDTFDRLELPADKPKLTVDPVLAPVADGTDMVDAEKLSLECGTMRCTKAEFDYLRSTYHNKVCDFLMVDPDQDVFMVAAFRLKASVTMLISAGETIVIKISGSRQYALGATNTLLIGENTPSCIIQGFVYGTDGVTPLAGALVSIAIASPARTYTDTTDKDGNYLVMVETPVTPTTTVATYTVTKSGNIFPTGQTLTINRYGIYDKDFQALRQGYLNG